MKILAYVLILAGTIHGFGCIVGGKPNYLFVSAIIAGGGVFLLVKAKNK